MTETTPEAREALRTAAEAEADALLMDVLGGGYSDTTLRVVTDHIVSFTRRALSPPAISEAVEAEREACARIADEHAKAWGLAHASPAIVIATAIRARTSISEVVG